MLCALLLPFTRQCPYKRYYLVDGKMRQNTHILATFESHTLTVQPIEAQLNIAADSETKFSRTGHILLLVGNDEGLQIARNANPAAKQAFEQCLAASSDPEADPPQANWEWEAWDTPQSKLNQTTAFKTALRRQNSPEPKESQQADQEMSPDSDEDMSQAEEERSCEPCTLQSEPGPAPERPDQQPMQVYELTMDENTQLLSNTAWNAFYTDGSKAEHSERAGAGVFSQTNQGNRGHMFTFDGPQSALRAELFGIQEATRLALEEQKPANIFTDSLTSLYLLQRWARSPNTLKHHVHRKILQNIMGLADSHPYPIKFGKAKAHIGIPGNEIADRLAQGATQDFSKERALGRLTAELEEMCQNISLETSKQIENSEETPPQGWMAVQHTRYDEKTTDIRSEPDFQMACEKHHLLTALAGGDTSSHHAVKRLLGDVARQNLRIDKWPDVLRKSDIWKTNSDAELTTFFQHLYNRVFTTNSYGHPLKKAASMNQCPLCNTGQDTAEHMRGACKNLLMTAQYTARHDRVVALLVGAIQRGPAGFRHLYWDPGARCSLESKSRNTVPFELLPEGPERDACPHKQPDIVTVDSDTQQLPITRANPLDASESYVLSILDALVVARDEYLISKALEKEQKYSELKNALENEGHSVTLKAIPLGSRVPTVGAELEGLKDLLQLEQQQLEKLIRTLWYEGLRSLRHLHLTYRLLANSTAGFKVRRATPAIPPSVRARHAQGRAASAARTQAMP